MKTAISIPDPVFRRVEQHASRPGVSRSEFFALAAARWADELDDDGITTANDAAPAQAGPDENGEFLARAATVALSRPDQQP